MSNIALFLAGGIGSRMNQTVPKQFMLINGKPLIIYALETFQLHAEIDAIAISCLEGREDFLRTLAAEYKITKLQHIVTGGETGQLSAANGVFELEKFYKPDDVVLIHDANRPLVSSKMISDCIATTQKFGNAYAFEPVVYATVVSDDEKTIQAIYPREKLKTCHTPNGFFLRDVCELHRRALRDGRKNSISSATLAAEYGQTVYLYRGERKNFKITTDDDVELLKAYLWLEGREGGG